VRLVDLLADAGVALEQAPTGDADVRAVEHDSRAVGPGALFACIVGATTDGHDHAPAAVAAGATALLVQRPLDLGVPEARVADVRRAVGPVAAAFHGRPSEHLAVVGVTGTNGKTTVTHLLGAVLEASGRATEVLGTLSGARTTPEATELQARLAAARAAGRAAVAMEVSSHALDLHRVDGTRFAVAAFTNLTVEHLDHHGTMDAYFAAKARLFTPDLAARGVVNADDAWGRRLLREAAIPVVPYSMADAEGLHVGIEGARFRWRGRPVALPLVGRFNVANSLAAATVAELLGVAADDVVAGLAGAPAVPGRMETVPTGLPFAVVVDYAHTPDGLVQVLSTLREVRPEGRIVVVFGCGGDRDRTKRPEMGRAAAAADVVVVTSDNPRSEDPGAIIDAVLAGIPQGTPTRVEPDRRAAIDLALHEARPGDVVLLAGKGHETHQEIGDRRIPFDDRVVARELLAGLGGGAA
jgi:UDP-N-acetylmuramoyl-L-alanyl-D-glutamate--2,6-diaminopimelate ligase